MADTNKQAFKDFKVELKMACVCVCHTTSGPK